MSLLGTLLAGLREKDRAELIQVMRRNHAVQLDNLEDPPPRRRRDADGILRRQDGTADQESSLADRDIERPST